MSSREREAGIFNIFVVGSIKGRFAKLFAQLTKFNHDHGPFEFIICPGQVFGTNNDEWEFVMSGRLVCPIPLLILGPRNSEEIQFYKKNENIGAGGYIAPNIYYLGPSGVFRTKTGFTIAYISLSQISENKWGISVDSANQILQAVNKEPNFMGVDFFISPIWPDQILNFISDVSTPPQCLENLHDPTRFDQTITKLAIILKPRFHASVFDHENPFFYVRPPFRVKSKLSNGHLSSFVSIAHVNNSARQKSIYSLKLSPLCMMKYQDLCIEPENITKDPYPDIAYDNEKVFYTKLPPVDLQQIEIEVSGNNDCWFCLENPMVQKHLIFHIAKHTYLSVAKGGLVADHMVLCTISHVSCTASLDKDTYDEMQQLKKIIRKIFHSQNKSVVMFERSYHSPHFQLQIVPIPKQNPIFLQNIYIRFGKKYNMDFQEMGKTELISTRIPPKTPYFYVEFDDGTRLIHLIDGKIPIQFGREVLACKEVLSLHPDRIDWKKCELAHNQESNKAIELREKFNRYL